MAHSLSKRWNYASNTPATAYSDIVLVLIQFMNYYVDSVLEKRTVFYFFVYVLVLRCEEVKDAPIDSIIFNGRELLAGFIFFIVRP